MYLQVTLRRIVEAGRPGVLAVLQDATALKTLEAQFVQSQKMQAIGQLAGGVAHDFNNLLTAISGHCDLLLLRHEREDLDYGDLVQIHQNANRAAALVGQLLAFSRKQTLKPETLDLQDVLSDLAHLLNRLVGERVRLRLTHGAGLGHIRADRRQLEQVLMNLVVNARDAMPEGGTIRLESEAVRLTEPMARDRATVPAGNYALIKVSDSGMGIPEDRLQKIFEPFFTTKKAGEGTGLGLSTAYGIVKQSGGFIFVDSTVGKGSVFQVYMPLHDGKGDADQPAVVAPKLVVKQGEGVVLLVEDEAPVRAFASRALRLRGYTVLEADSAEQALKALEDPALLVDVFVTDVVMPGMDGPSWVRRALHDRPNVKVIFVSGYAEEALAENQSRIPNSVFLPKPFSLNDLTATVQGQLN
jgi:two-component system cell cycle sensor histidine kinase/response regulator CckA